MRTYNFHQTAIANFATFSKIRHDISRELSAGNIPYFCRKFGKGVVKFVICCSRDWRFKGKCNMKVLVMNGNGNTAHCVSNSSFGKPCDAKWSSSRQNFLSHPRFHDRFL